MKSERYIKDWLQQSMAIKTNEMDHLTYEESIRLDAEIETLEGVLNNNE